MRKVLLGVSVLALAATSALAMELPDKPIENQREMQGQCRDYNCGRVVMNNHDWVPLTFNYDRLPTIHVGYGDDSRTPGDMLDSGVSGVLELPAGSYTFVGTGRDRMNVSVNPHQTTQIDFQARGSGNEIGVSMAVHNPTGTATGLIMGYRNRPPYELPPPPPPPPEPVHHDGWYDGGNGGGWGGGGDDGWGHRRGGHDGWGGDRHPYQADPEPVHHVGGGGPSIQLPPPQQGFQPWMRR